MPLTQKDAMILGALRRANYRDKRFDKWSDEKKAKHSALMMGKGVKIKAKKYKIKIFSDYQLMIIALAKKRFKSLSDMLEYQYEILKNCSGLATRSETLNKIKNLEIIISKGVK